MPALNETTRIVQLEQKVQQLSQLLATHQHTNDGTNRLRKNIQLDRDQWLSVGVMELINQNPTGQSGANDLFASAITVGPDSIEAGLQYKSKNLQMDFLHYPDSPGLSTIYAYASPLVSATQSVTVSTTIGGNTVTISGYNFATNELQGAFIDIFDSTMALVETQTIASNTATVITISGTWLASTSGGKFLIYQPVLLGAPHVILNRVYVNEGTATGGIRFGVGKTNNTQNGLLYMDATGDLYWRNKGGTSVKLN